ncbi:MAG: hypothetical protein JNK08_00155 [Sediminibacterium sp.]|nr:hypothetical protein [Sediminibacterium sp.]
MKYFFSVIFSIVVLNVAIAQDYKKVQTMVLLGKAEEAKTEVDKLVADPKAQNKPETWYWKSKVYASIYKNEALKAKYPDIAKQADEAFKKYIEIDPALAQVKEKGAEGFFDMYSTSFNTGLNDFKTKTWPSAALDFETATFYSDYIFKNKWANSTAAFDTTSILYAAYANQNAQNMDQAAKYYSRLAEAKVTGESFQDIYKFMADYYTKKKDKASFDRYIALGREVYPKENWEDYEIEYIDQNFDLSEKAAFYDKGDAAGTLSENQYLQFGDVFVNVRLKEADTSIHDQYTRKGVEAFKKAYGKNSQNALAAYNVAVIYYNFFNEADDRYAANIRALQQLNANKPVIKDPKKKAAEDAKFKVQVDELKKANQLVEKEATDNVDVAIDWLTKSYVILKEKATRTNTEKNVINKTVDFLANLYSYKMNKVRGKDPKAFDALEAKYKEFDALHSSFK